MKKLRLSYTLLNLWKNGRYDDAVIYYFKLAIITNQAMIEGKRWDEYVNRYVMANKAMPPEFGGSPLTSPIAQEKLQMAYNERYDLVGVIDVLDQTTLWEVKTGRSKDSGDYAADFQVALYFLLCETYHPEVNQAIISHYNQYTRKLDQALIWKSEYELERARNLIDTLAPEIEELFRQQGYLDK